MNRSSLSVVFSAFLAFLAPLPAAAQQALPGDNAVFAFGGVMARSHMGEMLLPVLVDYENNVVLGAGYQRFLWDLPYGFRVGVEAGLAGRFGEAASLETWAGGVARHDGLEFANGLRLSPSVTLGLSAVTRTMGMERQREIGDNRSASVVFYFSPELALSHRDSPETEVFWRLHHRSSAWRTLGGGSANATTVGLRHRF